MTFVCLVRKDSRSGTDLVFDFSNELDSCSPDVAVDRPRKGVFKSHPICLSTDVEDFRIKGVTSLRYFTEK